VIFVPPPFAADAILEAEDAGLPLIICITEGIPTNDMVKVWSVVSKSKSRAHWAQLPGCDLSRKSEDRHHAWPDPQARQRGHRFLAPAPSLMKRSISSRSEESASPRRSASAAIPSSAPPTLTHSKLLNEDPETESIILIGEIGGTAEEAAAAYVKAHVKKPVVGFIAGQTAPPGRRMGHAGAIISGGQGTAADKMKALTAAGIHVVQSPRRHWRKHWPK